MSIIFCTFAADFEIVTMTAQQIHELLKQGERLTLECKRCENKLPNSLWETYSSFANSYGGYILLGIEEHLHETDPNKRFAIQGVANPDKLITDFWNLANDPNKVNVNLLTDDDVQIVPVDGVNIIAIHVPQAEYSAKPVYINDNLTKGTFRRNHEGDYLCRKDYVFAMVRDANAEGNDGMLVHGCSLADIDSETLRGYRQMFRTIYPEHWLVGLDDKEFLRQMGGLALDQETGKECLTMAGLMMFGKGLPIRERFSNIRMDYVDLTQLYGDMRYSDRLTYDLTWENNLFNFFMFTMPRLTRDLPRPFVLEGIQRKDDTPAHRMVREAFTNMIIHADYLLTGVLKVEKREDGFFFSNPGMLRLPLEDIYKGGTSLARNPHMQNMMRMIGFGENLGTGFPAIVSTWEQAYHIRPVLSEHPSIFATELLLPTRVATTTESTNVTENHTETIQKSREKTTQTTTQTSSQTGSQTGSQTSSQRIVELIRENNKITTQAMADALGISRRAISKAIAKLQAQGVLRRVGGDFGGHWEIIE